MGAIDAKILLDSSDDFSGDGHGGATSNKFGFDELHFPGCKFGFLDDGLSI